jgi:hypothetical protein
MLTFLAARSPTRSGVSSSLFDGLDLGIQLNLRGLRPNAPMRARKDKRRCRFSILATCERSLLPSSKPPITHKFPSGYLDRTLLFKVDLGLIRHFSVKERFGLDLRGEWFNAFNHANFNSPNVSIGTAQAGVISSRFPARIIQLAAKVTF